MVAVPELRHERGAESHGDLLARRRPGRGLALPAARAGLVAAMQRAGVPNLQLGGGRLVCVLSPM